ncbi:hypothetical protein GMORB2_2874 [Geosmithia morbida]|uniref:Methyltransferase domain-containing protein n=1 Tax=Geosmithia morbida TaxID=1094350 RepID=A0A9P5CYH4_9HYPO|nr:uncharacterized protein GMORB2_2874 [Geosmithia morbida]KAF4120438.1 hypothetical protein GMORB2_2874 [Geosmithia morbida]
MAPEKPLPFSDEFSSVDDYVAELLDFVGSEQVFQILCGGVHILDFFTIESGLFHVALPQEWHAFLLSCPTPRFLDILVRDDLSSLVYDDGDVPPPESLLNYIRTVRRLSLSRRFDGPPGGKKLPKLPRTVSVGMRPKKIHEVTNFAEFVDRLAREVDARNADRGAGTDDRSDGKITHLVDFGSGQNYLGRALASEPYNRHVVAVEGREHNVSAAKSFDVSSGLAVADTVRRNKKLWNKVREVAGREGLKDPEIRARAIKEIVGEDPAAREAIDFRPKDQLSTTYEAEEGKGYVDYISGRLESGDLSAVISSVDRAHHNLSDAETRGRKLRLMAVSIHSCGNLSHYAIRSLLLNDDMRAVAIVGCCYNLLTERLGPPTYKHPYLRPTLQAINGKPTPEADRRDPQGFPMSERFATHNGGDGIRLNITARMMACQALQNWSGQESESFFTRHFFRAVAQKMFLDRGVVTKVRHRQPRPGEDDGPETPFDVSTNPVIIGSLPNSCYDSLKTYVRGAVAKITGNTEFADYADLMRERMGSITDQEIEEYEALYNPRRKELSVVWSLMAFSAIVVESLIVTDRWTFLTEQDVVERAWVEPVFDFKQSPRNLVVVVTRVSFDCGNCNPINLLPYPRRPPDSTQLDSPTAPIRSTRSTEQDRALKMNGEDRLWKFSRPEWLNSAWARNAGVYGAGALFSIAFYVMLDSAVWSRSARNGSDVHVKFVDWLPLIFSSLGMLIINSVEKQRLSTDSWSYSGSGVAWKARVVLFLGFAMLAGGMAGGVTVFVLKFVATNVSMPALGMGIENVVSNGLVGMRQVLPLPRLLLTVVLWISQNMEDEYSYNLSL